MKETVITKRTSSLLGEEYNYIEHKSGLKIYAFYKDRSTYYALLGTRYGSVARGYRALP